MGWRYFVRHTYRGLFQERFPICCVLRWSFETAFRSNFWQAKQRGVCRTSGTRVWVPCNLFHKEV